MWLAALLIGCTSENDERQKVYEKIIGLGPERYDLLLGSYPLEEQVEIYLQCRRNIHPPVCGSRVLARRGEEIVPVLLKRFEESRDLAEQRAIIGVFADMSCWYYNLSANEDVHEAAEDVINMIEDPRIREYAVLDLRIIKRETCPSASPGFKPGMERLEEVAPRVIWGDQEEAGPPF